VKRGLIPEARLDLSLKHLDLFGRAFPYASTPSPNPKPGAFLTSQKEDISIRLGQTGRAFLEDTIAHRLPNRPAATTLVILYSLPTRIQKPEAGGSVFTSLIPNILLGSLFRARGSAALEKGLDVFP
jgi:hypothetical protein